MIAEPPAQVFGKSHVEHNILKRGKNVASSSFRKESLPITSEVLSMIWPGLETLNIHSSISEDMDVLWSAFAIS